MPLTDSMSNFLCESYDKLRHILAARGFGLYWRRGSSGDFHRWNVLLSDLRVGEITVGPVGPSPEGVFLQVVGQEAVHIFPSGGVDIFVNWALLHICDELDLFGILEESGNEAARLSSLSLEDEFFNRMGA